MTEAPTVTPATQPIVPVSLVIADDHEVYRRGLQLILGHDPRIDVVGIASNGHEAVDLVTDLAPDVVLLDVRMPHLGGIAAAARIREVVPSTKILILTMSDDESDLFDAIKAGANGYLLKDSPGEEVTDSVVAVASGQSLIPPSMAAHLLTEFAALSKRGSSSVAGVPRLTERELEVLRLVAQGRANRDIAQTLFISENTVKNHVRNILDKLQLHSRMEAALYALRENLIDGS